MNVLNRQMVRLIQNSLQVGEDSPTYIIKLKRPHEFHLPPKELSVPKGAVVQIEVNASSNFGCSNASLTIENCYGFKSPEFKAEKHAEDTPIIADSQHNTIQQEYNQYLVPETWIQICLGYNWLVVPVLTGAIDTSEVNSNDSTLTVTIRDNMRYLVDQHIDIMVHGKKLVYPRIDNLAVVEQKDPDTLSRINMLRIVNVRSFLNIRTGPGTNNRSIGRAYNGQVFQYLDEEVNNQGQKWYKILFNGNERWIFHEYAEPVLTNAFIRTNEIVRITDLTTGAYLPIRNGPGFNYQEVDEVYFDEELEEDLEYMESEDGWHRFSYRRENESPRSGWTNGGYSSALESDSLRDNAMMFRNHTPVKSIPDNNSTTVAYAYDGNTYPFLVTEQDANGDPWHRIEVDIGGGVKVRGWVSDEVSSYEQQNSIVSFHTTVQVHGVTSHLHIRSGPSTKYQVLNRVGNNTVLPYLGTVRGEDGVSSWHHVLYMGRDGKYHEGYAHARYLRMQNGHRFETEGNPDKQPLDPSILIDMTLTTSPYHNRWTASGIVHDLAVQALYIGGRGEPFDLDRKICDVWTTEYTLPDDDTSQLSRYVVGQASFEHTVTYFDAAMEIVNKMGDMAFRCNRYGDIMLFRNRVSTQDDTPNLEVKDYVNLTEASLTYNVQDMRNRVFVQSDSGITLFEHRGITANQCKGVNRTFGMNVPFAGTLEKRKEVARAAFQQIQGHWRKMSIAIVGNPLIEIGDVIRVDDMVTTATSLFKVTECKHHFTQEGFITQLELIWVSRVELSSITVLSEELPSYARRFTYNKEFRGSPRSLYFKMPNTIYKAKIRLRDPIDNDILATIEVVGNTFDAQTTPPAVTRTKFIRLERDRVNIRIAANLNQNSVKKVRNAGFTMRFVNEHDDFYEGIDPEDGLNAFIWKQFCTTFEQHGNTQSNVGTGSAGAISTFNDLVTSRVGSGYAWGAQGEILTRTRLEQLKQIFGVRHYPQEVEQWIGKQVFDCSGLIIWALREMSLLSRTQDFASQGIFDVLCNEVGKSEVRPGDLFFRQGRGGIYHVGIMLTSNQVVEARGTKYGVIKRSLPGAERYGRLKKLASGTQYTIPMPIINTPISGNTASPIPTSYTITSTYHNPTPPLEVQNKLKSLSGNLLFYKDNCILYNIGIESDGADKNTLVIKWAPVLNTPINLNLTYDILMY